MAGILESLSVKRFPLLAHSLTTLGLRHLRLAWFCRSRWPSELFVFCFASSPYLLGLNMNTSAIMIALDQDGHFRHESGLPLVCIFDSQDGQKKPITETSWQRPITGIPAVNVEGPKLPPTSPVEYLYSRNSKHNRKPLKFVNTSRPGKNTRKTSKVAKSNRGVQDSVRRQRENNNELQILESTLASTSTSSGVALQPNGKEGLRRALISQQGRCLARHITTYPIPMKPYMFILLDFCMYSMLYIFSNPPLALYYCTITNT